VTLEERLKRRLVGGAVLVALVVIFVPMLFEENLVSERMFSETKIPDKPESLQRQLQSPTVLPEPVSVVTQTPEPVVEQSAPLEVEEKPKVGKVERPTPSAWMVQVASFSRQGNARKLIDRLGQAGMPAQLKEVVVKGKRLFRVQMFPQLNKKEAEKLVDEIEKQFGLKATLIRYAG
jgi:DedD protein